MRGGGGWGGGRTFPDRMKNSEKPKPGDLTVQHIRIEMKQKHSLRVIELRGGGTPYT